MTPQDMAYRRWANTTIEQRAEHARMMQRARRRKSTAQERREAARKAGLASAAKRAMMRDSS